MNAPSLEEVKDKVGYDEVGMKWENPFHALAVNVPGAVQMWEDLHSRYCVSSSSEFLGGKEFTLLELLQPAITLASEGFPVAGPVTSAMWCSGFESQVIPWLERGYYKEGEDLPLTVDGIRPPQAGEVYRNKDLAAVLRGIGEKGARGGFYENKEVAGKVCEAVREMGGCLEEEDFRIHESTWVDTIGVSYNGR